MMENVLEYKGYYSKVQFSSTDNVLHGKIEGIADLVTFESESCCDIENEFRAAVDDYLEFCEQIGKCPDKPYKGSFNVRIAPELHKRADVEAKKHGISLNQFVSDAITSYLKGEGKSIVMYYPIVVNKPWKFDSDVNNYVTDKSRTMDMNGVQMAWKM